MARRLGEMMEEAIEAADDIGVRVASKYPEANPDYVADKVRQAVQLYAAIKLCEALDDLAETIRVWTP